MSIAENTKPAGSLITLLGLKGEARIPQRGKRIIVFSAILRNPMQWCNRFRFLFIFTVVAIARRFGIGLRWTATCNRIAIGLAIGVSLFCKGFLVRLHDCTGFPGVLDKRQQLFRGRQDIAQLLLPVDHAVFPGLLAFGFLVDDQPLRQSLAQPAPSYRVVESEVPGNLLR